MSGSGLSAGTVVLLKPERRLQRQSVLTFFFSPVPVKVNENLQQGSR